MSHLALTGYIDGMTSLPAVRLCLIIVLAYVAFVQSALNISGTALYLAGAVFLLGGLLLAYRRSWDTARVSATLALIVLLTGQYASEYTPSTMYFDAEQPARIEGCVSRILAARSRFTRIIVEGDLDGRHLPSFTTRLALTLFHASGTSGSRIRPGARMIVAARVRRPDPAIIPGEFNEQSMCKSLGVSFVAQADAKDVHIVEQPYIIHNAISNVQEGITHALNAHVSLNIAAVLSAVLIGDESQIQRDARLAYAQSGTAHMFSVSGSHVAILLALGLVASVMVRRRWLRTVFLVTLVVTYVFISGGSAAAWRAAVMGLLALWGANTERDVIGLNVLAAAVLCMIVIDPLLPWSAGFQLSVAATAAIFILTPRWIHLLKRITIRDSALLRAIRTSCAVTLAASAGTSLPSALIFDQVAIWSPIANLFVVPILSLAMLAGAGLVIVHYAAPWLAPSLAWVCTVLVHAAEGIARFFAAMQPASDSSMLTVGVAVLTLGLCIWPLIASSWTGLIVRQTICMVLIVCVVIVPVPPASEVAIYARRSGKILVVRAGLHTVVAKALRKRDAGVESYIKSLQGDVRAVETSWDFTGLR